MISHLGKFEISVQRQVEWEEWADRIDSATVTFCLKYFKVFPWSVGEKSELLNIAYILLK